MSDGPLEDRIQVRHRQLAMSVQYDSMFGLDVPLSVIPGKTACVYLDEPPEQSAHGLWLPEEARGRLRQDHGIMVRSPVKEYAYSQVLVMPYDGLWFQTDGQEAGQYRLYGTVEKVWRSILLVIPAVNDHHHQVFRYPAVSSRGVNWSKTKPTGNNILLKSEGAPKKDPETGFYLPDDVANPPVEAEVIAVGPDVVNVKRGERVIFSPRMTMKIDYDGSMRYLIAPEDAIYAIVEGKL